MMEKETILEGIELLKLIDQNDQRLKRTDLMVSHYESVTFPGINLEIRLDTKSNRCEQLYFSTENILTMLKTQSSQLKSRQIDLNQKLNMLK